MYVELALPADVLIVIRNVIRSSELNGVKRLCALCFVKCQEANDSGSSKKKATLEIDGGR